MKKLLLLLPILLTLTACNNQETYEFKVKGHYTTYMTSEPQNYTHDLYVAYCESGVNTAYVEVPQGDTRETLKLRYTGYIIKYWLVGWEIGSNNGWMVA